MGVIVSLQKLAAAPGPAHAPLLLLLLGGRVAARHQDGAIRGGVQDCRIHHLQPSATDDHRVRDDKQGVVGDSRE